MPAEVKAKVDDATAKVRSVREQEDTSVINNVVEELMKVLQEVGQAAYSEQPETEENDEPSSEEEGASPQDLDVVDGEFTSAE